MRIAAIAAGMLSLLVAGALAGRGQAGPAAEAGYALDVEPAQVHTTEGSRGAVSLTIRPRAAHVIDRDGPLEVRVSVAPAGGVTMSRARYRRRDAADPRAEAPRFDLRYRAIAAGRYRLLVDVRMWVCRRYTCRPVRARRVVAVDVAPSPADPTPGPAVDAGRS